MCLYVDINLTQAFKKMYKRGEPVTMWKHFRTSVENESGESVHRDLASTEYYVAPYRGTPITAGWYKSGLKKKPDIDANKIINAGIHVWYKNQKERLCIPVIVFPEDLIAIGTHQDAVFTKIFISPQELDRNIKKYGINSKIYTKHTKSFNASIV
jgi:hypothetical protein